MLLAAITAVVVGLAALVWAADRFVLGASATAAHLGVAPVVVGVIVIGFGTSAPEMLVAAFAALQGNPALGIGNAVGSNIANIALIVGLTSVLYPLTSSSAMLRRELPIVVAATALGGLLLLDGELARLDGGLLLLGLAAAAGLLLWFALHPATPDDPLPGEIATQVEQAMSAGRAVVWLIVGLAALLVSSHILVRGAVEIATALGVSDLLIGLSVIAIGTSLPELATGLAAAVRREHDLLLGNILGSNIFNLLAVLALPGLIRPSIVPPEVLTRDLPVMGLLTLALAAMLLHRPGERARINRVEGAILLLLFVGYLGWLFSTL